MDFKKHLPQIIIAALLLILMMQTCGIKKVQRANEKTIFSLSEKIDSLILEVQKTPTKSEIEKMMRKNMYDFLIIEEDIDKGIISISEIKKKKIQNE